MKIILSAFALAGLLAGCDGDSAGVPGVMPDSTAVVAAASVDEGTASVAQALVLDGPTRIDLGEPLHAVTYHVYANWTLMCYMEVDWADGSPHTYTPLDFGGIEAVTKTWTRTGYFGVRVRTWYGNGGPTFVDGPWSPAYYVSVHAPPPKKGQQYAPEDGGPM